MKIIETTIKEESLCFKLENGTEVFIATNENYLHLSFAYTEGKIKASISHYDNLCPYVESSNIMDISYQPRKKD